MEKFYNITGETRAMIKNKVIDFSSGIEKTYKEIIKEIRKQGEEVRIEITKVLIPIAHEELKKYPNCGYVVDKRQGEERVDIILTYQGSLEFVFDKYNELCYDSFKIGIAENIIGELELVPSEKRKEELARLLAEAKAKFDAEFSKEEVDKAIEASGFKYTTK